MLCRDLRRFGESEAMALVRRHFATILTHSASLQSGTARPPTAERVDGMVDPNAELPALSAFHVPPARARSLRARALSTVLGDGESSRLHQELVKRTEICQSVQTSTDDSGPDLFSFW